MGGQDDIQGGDEGQDVICAVLVVALEISLGWVRFEAAYGYQTHL